MIRSKPKVWQRVCSDLLGVTAVFVVGLCAWPYTVDDAYIVARYAVRVSHAQGYTFNQGHATDGITGPAWLLPGIAASALDSDPVLAAKVIGLACCMLAALISIREQRARSRGTVSAWLTALLLACQPSLGGSGSSGLETGAATLALGLAIRATIALPAAQVTCLGWAIAGLAWLRPELAILCGVLLLIASVRVGLRAASPAWLLACVGAFSIACFRYRIDGSWLPLAWQAKAGSLSDGLGYSARAVLVLTGVAGVVLAGAGAWLGQPRDRMRAGLLLVHLLSVTLAGGDWMPGFRLFVPIFPQYAQLAAVGGERLLRKGGTLQLGAAIALVFACGVPLLDLALRIPEWRAAGASRDTVGAAIAARLGAESKRVALVDIGYLGYVSGCYVIDLAGLTDPDVAALRGGHLDKHIDAAWLAARAPDTLLLHSTLPPLAAEDGRLIGLRGYPVEMRIARSAWLQREFRVVKTYAYAPGYHYALLRRVPP